MKLGSVVFSKKGRDSGSFYVIVEVAEDGFVKIADGEKRKLTKPKLKRGKHLKDTGDVLQKIADKLESGSTVFDAEIRSALRQYNEK